MIRPIRELRRCVAVGGQLYMPCLVDTRKYMESMRRSGHFGIIRDVEQFADIVAHALGARVDVELKGNLAYVHAVPPPQGS